MGWTTGYPTTTGASFVPSADAVDDLGSSSFRFHNIYFSGLATGGRALFQSGVGGSTPLNIQVNTGHADGLRSRLSVENNANQAIVDMNIRGAVLNVGSTDSAVSAAGTQIIGYSPVGDTSIFMSIKVAGQGSGGNDALRLNRAGTITSFAWGLASTIYEIKAIGEAQPHFNIQESGTIYLQWGAGGSSSLDTQLFRSAAATLTLTNHLILGGNITIGAGTAITKHLSATATLDFGNILAAAAQDLTITVTGAAVGDSCYAAPTTTIESGIVWNAWVSSADTVTVRANNAGAIAVDPASRSWRADVWKH